MKLCEPRVLCDLYGVVGAFSVVEPLWCDGSLELNETSMMLWEPIVLWDLYDVVRA